jgi:hypothetical protein
MRTSGSPRGPHSAAAESDRRSVLARSLDGKPSRRPTYSVVVVCSGVVGVVVVAVSVVSLVVAVVVRSVVGWVAVVAGVVVGVWVDV